MLRKIFVAALALSVMACASNATLDKPAAAERQQEVAVVDTKKDDKASDDVKCRSERAIGSNLVKRTCRSKKQADQERQNAQQSVMEQQRGM